MSCAEFGSLTNLDASAFYIVLVLSHEYFTQKAKLLPYTTEVSLKHGQ